MLKDLKHTTQIQTEHDATVLLLVNFLGGGRNFLCFDHGEKESRNLNKTFELNGQ